MKSVKLMGAALAACALMAGTAFAAPREAAPTAFDPIAHQRVVEVSEQLRCLVCQNQSIADSNAELAVDLRNQVIEQVKAGKTNKEIVDYMVERYGDFVLYKPPFKANTVILWARPRRALPRGPRRVLPQPPPPQVGRRQDRPSAHRRGKGPRGQAALGRQGVTDADNLHHHLRRLLPDRDGRRGAAALVRRPQGR